MSPNACPTEQDLSDYLSGCLQDERAEEVEQHVPECEACQDTCMTISVADDTIVSSIGESVPEDPYERESACQDALAAIAEIGRDPSITSDRRTVARGTDTVADSSSIGEYRLLAKLGEGGMGTVYKALHTKLDKVVALKVLPAEGLQNRSEVERFEREMKAVGKLDHPNIVRAMDAGEVDGVHYLVMELIDGEDLSRLVGNHGQLGVADACELIRQAAVGLQEAHEHDMVHRDIKPSNLMLAIRKHEPPIVKILDMGLALLDSTHAVEQSELTGAGQIMGTLNYMAPEQGMDSHVVDIRADIYSLGATLYKLLCGEAPFPRSKFDTPIKTMMALATEDAPSIVTRREGIPRQLATIIDSMLSKIPEKRYSSPQEVADALLPLTDGANLTALLDKATNTVNETTKTPTAVANLEHQSEAVPAIQTLGSTHAVAGAKSVVANQSADGSGFDYDQASRVMVDSTAQSLDCHFSKCRGNHLARCDHFHLAHEGRKPRGYDR